MNHSPFCLKPKIDYPTSFGSLADFREALHFSITHHDERFFDYLCENFRVGDHEVIFVGFSSHSEGESNQHPSQVRSPKNRK